MAATVLACPRDRYEPTMKAGDRVVITGSEGLVGRYLRSALAARGVAVAGLDVLGAGGEKGDFRHEIGASRRARTA